MSGGTPNEFRQDPDGNWHVKPRARVSPGAKAAAVLLVLAAIGGGIWWNWWDTKQESECTVDAIGNGVPLSIADC